MFLKIILSKYLVTINKYLVNKKWVKLMILNKCLFRIIQINKFIKI